MHAYLVSLFTEYLFSCLISTIQLLVQAAFVFLFFPSSKFFFFFLLSCSSLGITTNLFSVGGLFMLFTGTIERMKTEQLSLSTPNDFYTLIIIYLIVWVLHCAL